MSQTSSLSVSPHSLPPTSRQQPQLNQWTGSSPSPLVQVNTYSGSAGPLSPPPQVTGTTSYFGSVGSLSPLAQVTRTASYSGSARPLSPPAQVTGTTSYSGSVGSLSPLAQVTRTASYSGSVVPLSPPAQVTRTTSYSDSVGPLSPLVQVTRTSYSGSVGPLSPPAQVTRTTGCARPQVTRTTSPDIDINYDEIFEDFDLMESSDWDFNTEEVINITDSPIPISPNPECSSTMASNSTFPTSNTKNSFKPPFLPSARGCNSSFGAHPGKPTVSKPTANKALRDDSYKFRSQYQHTREMYKIFNQVCLLLQHIVCIHS